MTLPTEMQERLAEILTNVAKRDRDELREDWFPIVDFMDCGWNFLTHQVRVLAGCVVCVQPSLLTGAYPSREVCPYLPHLDYVMYLVTSEEVPHVPYYKILFSPPNRDRIHLSLMGTKYLNERGSIVRETGARDEVFISRFIVDVIQEKEEGWIRIGLRNPLEVGDE